MEINLGFCSNDTLDLILDDANRYATFLVLNKQTNTEAYKEVTALIDAIYTEYIRRNC